MSNVKKLRQKLSRQKGARRRGYLKRFSANQINAGSKVDKSHVPVEVRGYFDYRKHAVYNPQQPRLDVKFPGSPQAGIEHAQRVEETILRLTSIINPADSCVLLRSKRIIIYLLWSSKRDVFILAERTRDYVRRSATFGSHDSAVRAFSSGRITWVYTQKIEPPS